MEVSIIETYYSLLKSYLVVQIGTVSYIEYFVRNIFGAALRTKSGDSKYCNFLNSKLHHGYISANFTKFSEPSSKNTFCQCVNQNTKLHVFEINIFSLPQFSFIFWKEL